MARSMPIAAAAAVAACKTGQPVHYQLNRNEDFRINGGGFLANVGFWITFTFQFQATRTSIITLTDCYKAYFTMNHERTDWLLKDATEDVSPDTSFLWCCCRNISASSNFCFPYCCQLYCITSEYRSPTFKAMIRPLCPTQPQRGQFSAPSYGNNAACE